MNVSFHSIASGVSCATEHWKLWRRGETKLAISLGHCPNYSRNPPTTQKNHPTISTLSVVSLPNHISPTSYSSLTQMRLVTPMMPKPLAGSGGESAILLWMQNLYPRRQVPPPHHLRGQIKATNWMAGAFRRAPLVIGQGKLEKNGK